MLTILRPALLAGLAVTVWTAAPLAAQTPDDPPADGRTRATGGAARRRA